MNPNWALVSICRLLHYFYLFAELYPTLSKQQNQTIPVNYFILNW